MARVLTRAQPRAFARRRLGVSERPPVPKAIVSTRIGRDVTFALPARLRTKHVWSFLWWELGRESK
ncbi:hypothetical protein MPNT_400015 [Candidatus Methylacidithermus pantelleriae]|uniref:Uncharacterized protein n=1 Tax=Candidatus Methylacidithermus pantelleriae TaxID=2744239 RepID=A0A8J2FWW5_9BACT|nr:hypothetical protein MPNT_400015 [Candidatus Methylacidithermus pantelleriae]